MFFFLQDHIKDNHRFSRHFIAWFDILELTFHFGMEPDKGKRPVHISIVRTPFFMKLDGRRWNGSKLATLDLSIFRTGESVTSLTFREL